MTDVPEVVLVCAHNANRRQIAVALLDRYANGRVQPVQVRLTGTEPADQSSPAVVAAVAECGIDLSEQFQAARSDGREARMIGDVPASGTERSCNGLHPAGPPRDDRPGSGAPPPDPDNRLRGWSWRQTRRVDTAFG